MDIRALFSLITASFTLGHAAWASNETLHPYGLSVPLRQWQGGVQATMPDIGVRPVASRGGMFATSPIAPDGAQRRAYVNTGGTRHNFEGAGAAQGSVSGAVGNEQFVLAAAGAIAIYSKDSGQLLLGPVSANAIFDNALPGPAMDACRSSGAHDAMILYDQLANRWLLSFHATLETGGISTHYQCIAISASADAGGSYHRYAITITTPHGKAQFADDMRMALWPDAYYLSFALFDGSAGAYQGARICGLDRHALAAGADAILRCRDLGANIGPPAPVHLEGYSTSSANPAAIFVALANGKSALQVFQYSWSRDLLSLTDPIPVKTFAAPAEAIYQPQPGTRIATMGDRIAPRAVYRNAGSRETVVANHTVDVGGGQSGLRWYDIGDPFGHPYLIEYGTIGGAGESRFMGSAGIDKAGNIALGYSAASADTPVGVRYTGREADDPFGTMQQEEIIVNGTGVAIDEVIAPRTTGALALDPIDGCTFWYAQRYVPISGTATWRARIASFKFRSCG